MKTLNFQVGRNYYHLLKEHSLTADGQVVNGFATITGFTKELIQPCDVLNIRGTNYEIVDVLEKRNHAGVFEKK